MNYLRHQYVKQLARNRYKLLVGSLLFLVLGSGFVPASADPWLFAALLLQNMLVGVLVFWEERPWVLLGSLLLGLGLEIAGQVWGWATVRAYTGAPVKNRPAGVGLQPF